MIILESYVNNNSHMIILESYVNNNSHDYIRIIYQ